MRQYRKSPTRGLIRALLGLATLLVAASGFFAVQGALAGAGSSARATTTVPAPDPPPVKPKAKPKPPPPPPPPVKHTVVVPPSPPPPSPPVTPPPPPPVVVAPSPPPAPVKTSSQIHHKAHRRHRVHRHHATVAPLVPRALMIRPAVAAPVVHVEAASAAAPLAANRPSSSGGGLGALVATLLALSALLLFAAIVPLHLLPIRLAAVLAPRRPDCATAGAIGLIAVAVAYLVAQA